TNLPPRRGLILERPNDFRNSATARAPGDVCSWEFQRVSSTPRRLCLRGLLLLNWGVPPATVKESSRLSGHPDFGETRALSQPPHPRRHLAIHHLPVRRRRRLRHRTLGGAQRPREC